MALCSTPRRLQWVHGLMTVVMPKVAEHVVKCLWALQWVHGLMTVVMFGRDGKRLPTGKRFNGSTA